MTRRFLSVVSSLLLLPSLALAVGGNHPMAGCGLGYVLLGKTSPGASSQTSASTTNQTVWNQVFGMTSGTSGCTPEGTASITKETERYVEINFESLRSEIARGQGEYVTGLVDLLGIPPVKKGAVVLLLKQDYADLFPVEGTHFDDFLRNLQTKLSNHPELLA